MAFNKILKNHVKGCVFYVSKIFMPEMTDISLSPSQRNVCTHYLQMLVLSPPKSKVACLNF